MGTKFWDRETIVVASAGVAALAGLGVVTFYANTQDEQPKPVVVTTEHNVIIDMPAGVRWDVMYYASDHTTAWMTADCNKAGGELIFDPRNGKDSWTCEGVDF